MTGHGHGYKRKSERIVRDSVALLAVAAASWSWGQPATSSLSVPALAAAKQDVAQLAAKLPAPKVQRTVLFELSQTERERLGRYLPRSLTKLTQRDPLHILALGNDSFGALADDANPTPRGFPTVFAAELAARFFYTGGVHAVGGELSQAQLMGPALSLRELDTPRGSIFDAAGAIKAAAKQMPLDIVLLGYQAERGISAAEFAKAAEAAVAAAREVGADVILCGPALPMTQDSEASWGAVRPMTDMARELAQESSILFCDLGDLSRLLRMPEIGSAEAAERFAAIEGAYRGLFRQRGDGEFVPSAALQSRLGRLIVEDLFAAGEPPGWSVTQNRVEITDEHLTLRMRVEHGAEAKEALTVLPLVIEGWRPAGVEPSAIVEPGAKTDLTIKYIRSSELPPALEEPLIRLPILCASGSVAKIEDTRAVPQPCAIIWSPVTLFNQEGSFVAGCQISNGGNNEMSGEWEAEMAGRKLRGRFSVRPQSTYPLDLQFDPPDAEGEAQAHSINVTIRSGDLELHFRKRVEWITNMGLSRRVALRTEQTGESADQVTLQAQASEADLTLTCTLGDPGLLSEPPMEGPAWQLELHLDARSYGKRLERGSTATVLITGGAADGPAVVHELAPWCFGTGYAAVFDAAELETSLSTAADGSRIIQVTIPRTYLYLHEWALENGNSQIGINARLILPREGATGTRTTTLYGLSLSGKHPADVDSLAVLELTRNPTQRRTVSLY